tara:strand:- start:1197 stop:1742 length:546 start_codon:yes stop_codon:yes gene_type:complete
MGNINLMKQDAPSYGGNVLVKGYLHCLQQCEDLVSRLDANDYAQSWKGSSSIGSHICHILDRVYSLFTGLPRNSVDYDARNREKDIESSAVSECFAIASISRRIRELNSIKLSGQIILVRETVYYHDAPIRSSSTVERELMGLVTHSAHHLAIISILARQWGQPMDQAFGKAPSALAYERF